MQHKDALAAQQLHQAKSDRDFMLSQTNYEPRLQEAGGIVLEDGREGTGWQREV